MNDHEAQRIAAAAHELRPDWPAASLLTLIRKNLLTKPRRDVAVALTWVACESGTSNPGRVLESGPWWRAAGIEATPTHHDGLRVHEVCGICMKPEDECRRRYAIEPEDLRHEFEMNTRTEEPAVNLPATITGIRQVIAEERDRKADEPEPEPTPTPDPTPHMARVRAAASEGAA